MGCGKQGWKEKWMFLLKTNCYYALADSLALLLAIKIMSHHHHHTSINGSSRSVTPSSSITLSLYPHFAHLSFRFFHTLLDRFTARSWWRCFSSFFCYICIASCTVRETIAKPKTSSSPDNGDWLTSRNLKCSIRSRNPQKIGCKGTCKDGRRKQVEENMQQPDNKSVIQNRNLASFLYIIIRENITCIF